MAEYVYHLEVLLLEGYTSRRKRRRGFSTSSRRTTSLLDNVPLTFVGHPAAFKKVIESGRNFLLPPAGGNQ
jgi:hypothetical protein